MSGYEDAVRDYVDSKGTVFYRVTPVYDGSVYDLRLGRPDAIEIQAIGVGADGSIGLKVHVKIINDASSRVIQMGSPV